MSEENKIFLKKNYDIDIAGLTNKEIFELLRNIIEKNNNKIILLEEKNSILKGFINNLENT